MAKVSGWKHRVRATEGGACPREKCAGLTGDLEELTDALRRYPWVELAAIRGGPQVLQKLEETEKLIQRFEKGSV
jgi:hypothetical protein